MSGLLSTTGTAQTRRWVVLLLLAVLLCLSAVPAHARHGHWKPHVSVAPHVVVPGVACRQYAQQQIGVAPGQAAMQSDINTAALGTTLGAAAGAGGIAEPHRHERERGQAGEGMAKALGLTHPPGNKRRAMESVD
jgi:hypothetical protein